MADIYKEKIKNNKEYLNSFTNNETIKKIIEEGYSILFSNLYVKDIKLLFGNKFYESLKDFKIYTTNINKGLINCGNINWLIKTDSENNLNQIKYIISKYCPYSFDTIVLDTTTMSPSDFSNCISKITTSIYTQTIILTNNFEEHSKYFKNYYVFSADFGDVDYIKKRRKYINWYLENSPVSLDKGIMDKLVKYNNMEIEIFLTKATINALKRHSNIITEKDICLPINSNYMEDFNELYGQSTAKEELIKILNYLQIAKKRNDIPSLSMIFNGNPRYTVKQHLQKYMEML